MVGPSSTASALPQEGRASLPPSRNAQPGKGEGSWDYCSNDHSSRETDTNAQKENVRELQFDQRRKKLYFVLGRLGKVS